MRMWTGFLFAGILLFMDPPAAASLTDRPRVRCEAGHLRLEGGANSNISLSTRGSGAVNINGVDVAGSLNLVSAVRPQLESLKQTDLGYLVANLSQVARTVASNSWIASNVNSLNTTVSRNKADVANLQTQVTTIQNRLDPLITNVSRLSTQVGLITPDAGQRLQQINSVIASLQQATTANAASVRAVAEVTVPQIRQTLVQLQAGLSGLPQLQNRLAALENSTTFLPSVTANSTTGVSSVALSLLHREVMQLKSQLQRDECASNPCQHGATCIDGYLKHTCLCPKGWMGSNCDVDVNECYEYMGSDLGCQHGAQCINTPGSYRCVCTAGWYGVNCNQRSDNCSSSSGTALCGGHGTCIPSSRGVHPYTCICDEGWKPGTNSPACVDVDECASPRPHCSRNPPVHCYNTPGSFICGHCPSGYTGDGFVCNDVDECQINNGGCSPFSVCYNTIGSHRCGPCASGYTGDGTNCYPSSRPCQMSPCHPLAQCYDNPQISPSFYQCVCPPGYSGTGIGPQGCVFSGGSTGGQPTNWCASSPCRNGGTCTQTAYSFTCICQPGYAGQTCETDVDECASNPCQNGGTCTQGLNTFTCTCPASHTGDFCQTENQQCGGRLEGTGGVVEFPVGAAGQMYNHNTSCAWAISVHPTKVINITFGYFHLEESYCNYDWLQIHDGPNMQSQVYGRYCGTSLPGTNGTIISTHNHLYLWFRSDHSIAGYGFNFTWNATDPVCGGLYEGAEYGSVKSPGYPGRYPHNRDCYWIIEVPLGKRVKFHFPTLQIETHTNCSYDFLEVRDGRTETSPSLGKFCSTVTPAPVTATGREALLHFHSDSSYSDTGFLISYSAEPGIPGCGGLLSNEHGEFSAPTLSDRYHHNLRCEWEIRVHPRERINLNFTEFHLEYERACRFDYLEVRDGGTADSPLIVKACGVNIPEPIQSTGNKLFVVFVSDYSFAHAGFRARYRVACGGEYSAPTGIIRSPYSPDRYPANRECVYLINQPPGKAILLNFTFFDIEGPSFWSGRCVFDYVEIRDGRRPTSPLLGRYCGPETHRPDPVLATHNYMWIKFVTDSSEHNYGFIANYSTVDTSCGGVLTALTGVISSPNSPQNYPANTDCIWVLDLPQGYVIQLTWTSFMLEGRRNCPYDYIEIFDNSSIPGAGGQMGDRFCGNTLPPVMTSSDNLVTIRFHSDHTVNHDGFSAFYHGIDASRACGGHYHTVTGVLTSPNYPENYPNSRTCEWTITVPPRRQIRLRFVDMQMEEENHCSYDYLEIRNGRYSTSPLLNRICSFNRTLPEILSHSNQLYLKFHSDSYLTKKGFKILWDGLTTGCGGTLTGVSGEIVSPGYPQPYHHRADCYWTIRVAQGSSVSLYFTDLDLESARNCFYDYVEVRDGSTRRSPLLGRYCTNSQGVMGINSTSNTLWIRFRSDHTQAERGFKAQYHTNCNRVIRGHRGTITTPNYPDPYPHDRNCTWIIVAPRGNSINASFSDFVLEDHMDHEGIRCSFDYVEVREAETLQGSRTQLGHFCRNPPPPLSTSLHKNVLEVHFLSDYSVAENGFRLEWIVHGCGGHFTKASDSFTSPNYPHMYPPETDCEWYIRTAPGTRVHLTIHDFDIESAGGCVYDSLNVYGGQDVSSPLLTTLCHQQQQPVVVTSQGNHAFITFSSDESLRGRGFNISYNTLPDGCGGRFTAPRGSIHSPNYPEPYDKDSSCVWTIVVNPTHVVELNFTEFDVEPHANCSYDNVTVYDGEDTTAPVLFHHCGNTIPETAFVRSTSNAITVRLLSDGSFGGKGFFANYSMGCGARLEVGLEGFGELLSPNYPHLYTSTANCSWHLHAPEGHRIYLHIVHLSMHPRFPGSENCTYDYVSVLEGDMYDSPEKVRYCGTSSPRPLVSESEYLTVNLASEYGFSVIFRAVYSVLTSACGGDLSSERGELATPHYPEPYPVNLECVWTITAGPGNRLQLNFQEFDIEASDGCNLDYLEVHQGNAAGPLLLHNCSTSPSFIPGSITAKDKLWIKFRSDGTSGGASGFLASYSLLYGSSLYGMQGEVVSPLYPHKYVGNEDVIWKIYVPRRKYVSITFLDLDIEGDPVDEACYASLVFYNGWSVNYSPVLGTFCGHGTPSEPLVSTRRLVTVKFTANSVHKGSRFRFRFEAVDTRGSPGITQRRDSANNCSYEITLNSTGTMVTSPGYPVTGHNVDCEWVIQSSPHERVSMHVWFQLEESSSCGFDYLEVYDGVGGTRNWNRTHKLCRRDQRTTESIISSGRFLRLHFVTDGSVTSRGFMAHFLPVCGGIMEGSEGVIQTPNYPEDYSYNQNCLWTIRVGIGRTIKLEFDTFRIANSTPSCGGDYLTVRNGGSTSSPFLGSGKYCGQVSPGQLESSSNQLLLNFVSDGSEVEKGFKLRYYEQADACGGSHVLTEELNEITLESPNPPQPYTECAWTVMAPPEKSISLHFVGHFEFPGSFGSCDQSFVEVRDGGTVVSPLLGKFCGTTLPDTQHTTGDFIYVRYYNNGTSHHAGFKAKANIDTCGGTYNAWAGGILTTPNYPTPYASDLNCTWRIIAPLGHYVSLHFLDMDLYSVGNNCTNPRGRLQIRDKNATGEVLATLCSPQENLPPIDTPSNIAYITFKAGPNTFRRHGFRIQYNMSLEVCGGEVGGVEGFIQSPGYPHGYAAERSCIWIIRGPTGRRVTLDIVDLDLPPQTTSFMGMNFDACVDALLVKNGDSKDDPAIDYLCGRETTSTMNSSMNTMWVMFRTSGHSNARGFKARWTTEELQECGGEINPNNASIGFDGTQVNSIASKHCVWTATNPNLHNSSFFVSFLDRQLDEHCISSVVIEGVNSEGQVATREEICGATSPPPTLLVPDLRIRITFNKPRFRRPTWNLTLSVSPCGGILWGPQDVLASPNFPSNYPNNARCSWALRYGQGEQIDFKFTSFNLEDAIHHDYVMVHNGPRFTSPLMGRYTGTGIQMNVGRSMTNSIMVQFRTDGSGARQGFRAIADRHTRGCGGLFHGRSGSFSSSGFPNDYSANLECEWEIDTPAGYHAVLTFNHSFDIETSDNCQNDYLQVLHSERPQDDPHGPLQWVGDQKLCGKQMPSPIVSSGDRVKLLFHTNAEVQGGGFQVSWDTGCGINYTQPSGYIVSPGHPEKYPNNVNCLYRIIADEELFVVIHFLSFELEDSYNCRFDKLQMYEERRRRRWGRNRVTRGRTWGPYCGEQGPPSVLTTKGTTVLNFTTDRSVTKLGFVANFSVQGCGGNLSAPTTLQLPTRPVYHNHMNCVWDITAPENKVAHIKFQELHLESHRHCIWDSVSVYDGHTSSDDHLIQRLCGDHSSALPVVVAPGRLSRVEFTSDFTGQYLGFTAALEFTYACGGNVNISAPDATDTIRSLDADNDGYYEPLLECRWLVVGQNDQVVTLTFTRLDLEPPGANDTDPCPYDKIEIYDGPSRRSPLISALCNTTSLPGPISASSNVMLVYFKSDSTNASPHVGFTATLSNTPHPCGVSSFQAMNETQALQSPGYPNSYPISTRCRWIITAPEADQQIHLEFNDFHLEQSFQCSKDQLYIADFDPTSPANSDVINPGRLYRYYTNIGGHRVHFSYSSYLGHGYCGSAFLHHLTSFTNAVELRLVSDEATTAAGFRLHYSIASCNRTFNGTSGFVKAYRGQWCFTTIQAPQGSFINIYFSNFYISNRGQNCTAGNTLRVYDGADSSARLLISACGWRNPTPVYSTGNVLRLEHTPRGYGRFALTYTTSSVGGGCGGSMFVRQSAGLSSPGYPGPPPPNQDCMFSVAVPPDHHAAVWFNVDFASSEGCNSTFLEVYDVDAFGESTLFNTVCGQEDLASHLTPSNRLVLRYVTGGGNITGQGWSVRLRAGLPHESTVFETAQTGE